MAEQRKVKIKVENIEKGGRGGPKHHRPIETDKGQWKE
jgi:hypothetical protein